MSVRVAYSAVVSFLSDCAVFFEHTNTQSVVSHCFFRDTELLSNREQWSYRATVAGPGSVLVNSKDSVSADIRAGLFLEHNNGESGYFKIQPVRKMF